MPKWDNDKIAVVGDTGCRLGASHGGLYQSCNNPSLWPAAQVLKSAADAGPDLIFHVSCDVAICARLPFLCADVVPRLAGRRRWEITFTARVLGKSMAADLPMLHQRHAQSIVIAPDSPCPVHSATYLNNEGEEGEIGGCKESPYYYTGNKADTAPPNVAENFAVWQADWFEWPRIP